MSDPFLIEGPAVISFSGGRTSGMMLHHILRAHNWILPDDVVVVFCNTGKEHEKTLDFVRDCGAHWNVPIRWIEWRDAEEPKDRWREVDHATASRNGEPFEALIRRKGFLPNPVTRFCTTEMKIHATHRFIVHGLAWDYGYYKAIGLRADEPGRVARGRARYHADPWICTYPLYDAGATVRDVVEFWSRQPFDLALPNHNGTTPLGNCDLCFLKSAGKIASIIAAEPERARWWARMETLIALEPPHVRVRAIYADDDEDEAGDPIAWTAVAADNRDRFRKDRPSYAAMLAQGNLALFEDAPDTMDCACTD